MKRSVWMGAAIALLAMAAALMAQPPEGAPDAAELVARATEGIKGQVNVHMTIDTVQTVNGTEMPVQTQEVWVRDFHHLRSDVPNQNVVAVITLDEVVLYHGPSAVGIHVPKETLDAFGDEFDDKLAAVGIGLPTRLFEAFAETAQSTEVTSEDEIGGVECWVLTVGEEALEDWADAIPVGQPGMEVKPKLINLALEKENAMFRGVYMDLTLLQPNGVGIDVQVNVTVPTVEEMEIPDEMLIFDVPEDATMIEWAPDREGAEIMQEFQLAVTAEMANQ